MSNELIHSEYEGTHGEIPFRKMTYFRNVLQIDGVAVIAVLFDTDNKWWIIPDGFSVDFQDMGPYDTVEDAIMWMRLYGKEE